MSLLSISMEWTPLYTAFLMEVEECRKHQVRKSLFDRFLYPCCLPLINNVFHLLTSLIFLLLQ